MDFVRSFFGRHKELSVRRGNLIKRSRAALTHTDVNEFFDPYEKLQKISSTVTKPIYRQDSIYFAVSLWQKCGYIGGMMVVGSGTVQVFYGNKVYKTK
jgi:hypothetical protein